MLRASVILIAIAGAVLIASAQPAGNPDDDTGDDTDDDSGDTAGSALPPTPEGVAALDQHRSTRVGFDHLTHDRDLVVANHDSIPCATCHPTRGKGELAGRPDHKACFGACHGAAPVRTAGAVTVGDRAKVCAACHAPTDLIRADKGGRGSPKLTVAYPAYTIDPDFGMQMSHQAHAATACTTCHATAPKPRAAATKLAPGAVHARCKTCHDKAAQPAMSACASCHVAAFGSASGPTMAAKAEALPVAFDHAGHGKRATAPCTTCHATVATTASIELPRPAATDCASAGCHDGSKAFSITEACTRCHRDRPTGWEVYRPAARFSHDKHAERIGTADCTSCHKLGRSGDAVTIGHAACSDAKCHAASFTERKPEICAGCHVGTEPWLPLTEDQRPRDETEHGALMPHAKHKQPCTSCHVLASGTRELRPPRGHKSCIGTGCHAAGAAGQPGDTGSVTRGAASPAPKLDDCEGCHRAGLVEARNQLRRDARWSVRARFKHAAHAVAKDRTPLACETCHAGIADSTEPTDVPTPAKATCTGCHNGATAFKVTGTGCAKCHGT